MQRKGLTDIPVELADMVVDHLHDDKTSLRHCSLVSRSWLDAARYHLFYQVDLNPGILHRPHERVDIIATQIDVFTSRCAFAWSFVRVLSIGAASGHRKDNLTYQELQTTVRLLPMLHSLLLQNITISVPSTNIPTTPTIPLRCLTMLNIELASLGYVIGMFSSIQQWNILGRLNRLGSWETVDLHLLGLQSLVIQEARVEAIVEHFTRIPFQQIHSSLTSFTIGLEYLDWTSPFQGTDHLNRALSIIGDRLRYLRVDYGAVHFSHATLAQWEQIDLSSCTSLETLGLCLFSGEHPLSDDDIPLQWSATVHLLSKISAKAPLRQIIIGIFSAYFQLEMVAAVSWHRVEEQLMRFKSLQFVRIHGEMRDVNSRPYFENAKPFADSTKDALRLCMPQAAKRGLLTFL